MAVTFVKEWAQWSGTSPSSSASTSPGAAGNSLVVFGQNESAGAITPSGAGGTQLSPPGAIADGVGDTHAISVNLSLSAGAQVVTLTGSAAQTLEGQAYEFSGVGTVTNGDSKVAAATGATFSGNAISVPTGSFLIALVKCVSTLAGTASVTGGGTSLGSGAGTFPVYAVGLWTGAGSSITPQFTVTQTADTFVVLQAIINPPSAPIINTQPPRQGAAPGPSVTFSVSATASAGSLTYQWYRNGVSIGGATSSSYTFTPNFPADYGATFYVIVTDSNGSTQTNSVSVIWYLPRIGRLLPAMLDDGNQDFKSELTLLRWF